MTVHDAADRRALAWELRVAPGNQARLLLPDDAAVLQVDIAASPTKDAWDIQLNQANLAIQAGMRYRLMFQCRASGSGSAGVGVSRAHAPWDNLGLYRGIELSADWQPFALEFIAAATDRNARVHFDVGGNELAVEFSGVALLQLPDGVPIEPEFAIHGFYPAHRSLPPHAARLPDEAPRFSVVIPTHRRRDTVVRAVRAFAEQKFDGGFEVIVVIDGATDDTAAALRGLQMPFPLTVVEQSNQGAAAARNRGAASARGEVFLFLDDDMEPHPMLLAEHEYSYGLGADAVLGHIPLHPAAPANFLSAEYRTFAVNRAARLSQPGAELTLQDLLTGQLSVRRDVFEAARGFDTSFTQGGTYGNEDVDFGHRLLASGLRIEFNLYALSHHDYRIQPRHYLRQARQTGKADVAFARKHPRQAAAIFAPYTTGSWLRPKIWRALAAMRPWTAPLAATLRRYGLAVSERGSVRAGWWCGAVFEMEYWRGVREAGGMPRIGLVRVLNYHAIRDLSGSTMEQYGTPPRQFRRQMQMLRRLGFHFIDGDGFLQFLLHGGDLPDRAVLVTFDDCYDDLLQAALPVLADLRIPAVAFAVSSLLGRSNKWGQPNGAPELPLLDAAALRLLAAQGVETGAHSRTHRPLSEVADAELPNEIAACVDELQRAGIPRPRMFAYPYGAWSLPARGAVRAAGIEAAFTVEPGFVRSGRDPLLVPRLEILRQHTGWRFLRKVITGR